MYMVYMRYPQVEGIRKYNDSNVANRNNDSSLSRKSYEPKVCVYIGRTVYS